MSPGFSESLPYATRLLRWICLSLMSPTSSPASCTALCTLDPSGIFNHFIPLLPRIINGTSILGISPLLRAYVFNNWCAPSVTTNFRSTWLPDRKTKKAAAHGCQCRTEFFRTCPLPRPSPAAARIDGSSCWFCALQQTHYRLSSCSQRRERIGLLFSSLTHSSGLDDIHTGML